MVAGAVRGSRKYILSQDNTTLNEIELLFVTKKER